MMSEAGILSQAEIDALLHQGEASSAVGEAAGEDADDSTGAPSGVPSETERISGEEADAIGEIGNITMGTAATALSTLLGKKVAITTPRVQLVKMEDNLAESPQVCVMVKVEYTAGLTGLNLFILDTRDAAIIGDLMMGLAGTAEDIPLDEIHMSAVSEAMNQMMGSAATAMSSMFKCRIDISPPQTRVWDVSEVGQLPPGFDPEEDLVRVAFHLHVEGLIDSDFYQLLPLGLAKEMVNNLYSSMASSGAAVAEVTAASQGPVTAQPRPRPADPAAPGNSAASVARMASTMPAAPPPAPTLASRAAGGGDGRSGGQRQLIGSPAGGNLGGSVEVRRAEFAQLDSASDAVGLPAAGPNIHLLLDVPLQVTVELGRTRMTVKDVLELGKGAVVELERLAGEPIDVLVNGKLIAKGEVVVIDESFGVKITSIVTPAERVERLQ